MYLLSLPSKHKSIKLLSAIRSLLCSNLLCKLEKLQFETEVAFLHLLSSFIGAIIGLLFCATQKC